MPVDKKYSEFKAVGSVASSDTSVGERPSNPVGQKYIRPTQAQVATFMQGAILPLKFVSDWNANTNSPALASGVGTEGHFYRVSVDGTTTLNGVTDWVVNDWAWFDGTAWRKNNGGVPVVPVDSVFGRIGSIIAVLNDYAASLINNDSTVTGATVKDALETLLASIPTKEVFSGNYAGGAQTFTLPTAPSTPSKVTAFWNGQEGENGVNFSVSGTTLTWIDTLTVGDRISAFYNDEAGGSAPVDSVFGRTSAVVAAASDYDASQVDNDSGVTGAFVSDALDTLNAKPSDVTTVFGRSAAVVAVANDYDASEINNDSSVPGAQLDNALGYNNTTENFVSKAFGDSPYNALIGDLLTVDTNGGNVSVVLPSASGIAGARIRVSKATSDVNTVTLTGTGGDTIGMAASVVLSHFGDGLTAFSDGGTNWIIFQERSTTGTALFLPDHDSNNGFHRVQNIGASANANFEFIVPDDFSSIISLTITLTVNAGAAGSGKDIDLSSDYGAPGEILNFHSETDATTVYDFTGLTDIFNEINIAPVFSSLSANDICGLNVDHNGIGGTGSYYNIKLVYQKRS